MGEQIKINYQVVESETSNIHAQLQAERAAMEESYRNIQARLDRLDGAANTATKEFALETENRALAATMLLNKLILFAAKSSQIVEEQEREIANVFSA